MSREEIANTISHGLGLILALVAVPMLIAAAVRAGNMRFTVGVSGEILIDDSTSIHTL